MNADELRRAADPLHVEEAEPSAYIEFHDDWPTCPDCGEHLHPASGPLYVIRPEYRVSLRRRALRLAERAIRRVRR